MKNYQYLTNGVIESYLLGLVSDDEKQEVEQLLATDQEVLSQLNELETEMEQYFLRNAVPPPPAVKTAIFDRINKTQIKKWGEDEYAHSKQKPADEESPKPNYIDVEVDNTHIQVHKYWRPAFVAVFILSKIFLILGLYYYFKSASLEQEITRLKATSQQSSPLPSSSKP